MTLLESLLLDRRNRNSLHLDPPPPNYFLSEMEMDWKETPHAHVFYVDLPGLTKQDVKLELIASDQTILCISASRREDEEEDEKSAAGVKWHCRERKHRGAFSRQFRLPENAMVDEIKASLHDGVLVVTVPKDHHKNKSSKQRKAKAVQIDDAAVANSKGLGRFVCCKA